MYSDETLKAEADTYLKEERGRERRQLLKSGILDAKVQEMVDRCNRRAAALQEDGVPVKQAWFTARREMVGRQPD